MSKSARCVDPVLDRRPVSPPFNIKSGNIRDGLLDWGMGERKGSAAWEWEKWGERVQLSMGERGERVRHATRKQRHTIGRRPATRYGASTLGDGAVDGTAGGTVDGTVNLGRKLGFKGTKRHRGK